MWLASDRLFSDFSNIMTIQKRHDYRIPPRPKITYDTVFIRNNSLDAFVRRIDPFSLDIDPNNGNAEFPLTSYSSHKNFSELKEKAHFKAPNYLRDGNVEYFLDHQTNLRSLEPPITGTVKIIIHERENVVYASGAVVSPNTIFSVSHLFQDLKE